MKTQRIFIASPGDVEAERRIAARLVHRLAADFAPYFDIELTSWEEEPLLASADFQSQISPPEDSDIFVAIFWGRLGSPLDSKYQRDDGSFYASATEYEFEMAMASYLTVGKPRMLVYRKTAPFNVTTEEEKAQLASLDAFFEHWFLNLDGTAKRAHHTFGDSARFEETLELHLVGLLAELVPPPNNLPAPTTAFIGREALSATVCQHMMSEDIRLVTLVGPGGTGKTRLGLEVANNLLGRFRDGIYFVSLASITDPDLVPLAIADVLQLPERANISVLDNIVLGIKRKSMLLLIDNFEQVQSGSRYLGELLQHCPDLKIIVTSRESLRLRGAMTVRVPPLGMPEEHELLNTEALACCESVRLFVERAQSVREDFELTDENAAEVAGICRRVDALPLAIELAASRIRSMSPERLLGALDQRFRVLSRGADDLLDHQRSLSELIAWSYELLEDQEQRLWRTLAIFPAGCTVETAQAVCDPDNEFLIELDIESLVDKSMVNIRQHASEAPTLDSSPRITMLETLREYASDQLVANKEFESLHDRFRKWCIKIAENRKTTESGVVRQDWINYIEQEYDNLRHALEMASSRQLPEDLIFGIRLSGALSDYWSASGVIGEAVSWLSWAVSSNYKGRDSFRARALFGLALHLRLQSTLKDAEAAAQESLDIYVEIVDDQGRVTALKELGAIAELAGEYDQAEVYFKQALALLGEEPKNQHALSELLAWMGVVDHVRGDLAGARNHYERCLQISRDIGFMRGVAQALVNLSEVADSEGDHEVAFDSLREGMLLLGSLRIDWAVAYCAEVLAGLESRVRHRPSEAAFLFGAADMLREELDTPIDALNAERLQRDLQLTKDELSAEEFAKAWDAGRRSGMKGALERIEVLTS